jgi:hypothetical protein
LDEISFNIHTFLFYQKIAKKAIFWRINCGLALYSRAEAREYSARKYDILPTAGTVGYPVNWKGKDI